MVSNMIDHGPCEVRGAIRGSRARVIYAGGVLYVVKNVSTVVSVVASEPVQAGDKWKVTTASGEVSWFRRGCSCSYTLKRFPAADLIAKAVPL